MLKSHLHETQDAIALVKSQLEAIAVDNIKIQELGNGTLKITYYSDVDVSEIKKIFTGERNVAVDYTTLDSNKQDTTVPSEKDVKTYQLDIYEIQEANDLVGSSGNVIESKSEIIRFFTPDTYAAISKQCSEGRNKAEKLAYIIHRNTAIAIDGSSYTIPEVRAGPTA